MDSGGRRLTRFRGEAGKDLLSALELLDEGDYGQRVHSVGAQPGIEKGRLALFRAPRDHGLALRLARGRRRFDRRRGDAPRIRMSGFTQGMGRP